MARKEKGRKRGKSRRRAGTALVRAASKGTRRRHRRNPPGAASLLAFGIGAAVDTGILVGVRAGQRVWPQLVKLDTATAMGRGAQAVAAVLAGGVLHFMGHDRLGQKIAAAGLSVPAEAVLHDMTKDSANPMVASAFGDDTVLLTAYPGPGVGAYPATAMGSGAERNGMGAYPGPGNPGLVIRDGRGMGSYPANSVQQ